MEPIDALGQSRERLLQQMRGLNEDLSPSVGSVISNLGKGFFEGFTTLGIGDDPVNRVDAMAHNIGSLMGFIGFVPGPGILGKIGASSVGRALGGAKLAAKFGQSAVNPLRGFSIPMAAASKIVGGQTFKNIPGASARKFLTGQLGGKYGGVIGDAVAGGLHLGVASGVASWQEGIDGMAQSFLFGAQFGAAGRFLGTAFNKGGLWELGSDGANLAARAMSSSLYQGLQSTYRGDPIEIQVYEYLMGAYFGGRELPFHVRRASNFIAEKVSAGDLIKSPEQLRKLFDPESIDGFGNLDKATQDEVKTQADLMWGRSYQMVMNKAGKQFTTAEAIIAKAMETAVGSDDKIPEEVIKLVEATGGKTTLVELGMADMMRKINEGLDAGKKGEEAFEDAKKSFANESIPKLQEVRRQRVEELIKLERSRRGETDEIIRTVEDHDMPISFESPLRAISERIAGTIDGIDVELVSKDLEATVAKHMDGNTGKTDGQRYLDMVEEIKGRYGEDAVPKKELYKLRRVWKNAAPESRYRPGFQMDFSQKEGAVSHDYGDGAETNRGLDGNVASSKGFPSFIDRVLSREGVQTVSSRQIKQRVQDGFNWWGGAKFKNKVLDFFDEKSKFSGARYAIETAINGRPLIGFVKDKGEALHSEGYFDEAFLMRDENGVPDYQATLDAAGRTAPLRVDGIVKAIRDMANSGSYDAEKRSALYKAANEFSELYSAGKQSFIEAAREDKSIKYSTKTVSDAYDAIWLSRVGLFERMNSNDQSQISYAEMVVDSVTGNGDFVLDAQSFNKRLQVFADSNPTASMDFQARVDAGDRQTIADIGGARGVLVTDIDSMLKTNNDVAGVRNFDVYRVVDGEARAVAAEELTDGAIILRKDYFDALAADGGIHPDAGFIKISAVSRGNEETPMGSMIVKAGGFIASPEMSAQMKKSGLHYMLYKSGAKQTGRRKVYDLKVFEDGGLGFMDKGQRVDPDTYILAPEDIRINASASEDPGKIFKDIRVPKQLITNWTDDAAISHFFEQHTKRDLEGLPETNEMVRAFLQGRGDLGDFNIDDMSIQMILDVVAGEQGVSNSKLYDRVWSQLYREARNAPDELADGILSEGVKEFIGESTTAVQAVIRSLEGTGLISPVVVHDAMFDGYSQNLLKNYLIKRAMSPKVPYSASVIMTPLFPHDRQYLARVYDESGGFAGLEGGLLKRGEFVLDSAHRKRKVRWLGDEVVTMDQAFNELVEIREMNTKTGEDGKKLVSDEQLATAERLLGHVAVRVPADSQSGARIVRFMGFTNRKGGGASFHPDDMLLQGGADNDGDKSFIIQNIDNVKDPGDPNAKWPITDHILSADREWADPAHPDKFVPMDAKDGYREGIVRDRALTAKTPSSGLDPLASIAVGRDSRVGNLLIGPVANSGRYGDEMFRRMREKGYVTMQFTSNRKRSFKDPEKAGDYLVLMKNKKGNKKFLRLRRALMNFAADAANEPVGIRREEAIDKLVRSLVDGVEIYHQNGTPVKNPKAVWDNLKLSFSGIDELSTISNLDRTIAGRDGETGRKFGVFDFLKTARTYAASKPEGSRSNPWYEMGGHLGRLKFRSYGGALIGKGSHVDPATVMPGLSMVKVRNLVNQVALISRAAGNGERGQNKPVDRFAETIFALMGRNNKNGIFFRPYDPAYKYGEEWQVLRDLDDLHAFSVLPKYGVEALRAGSSMSRLQEIQQRIRRHGDIDKGAASPIAREGGFLQRINALNRDKPLIKNDTIERVAAEAKVYRETLTPAEQTYFDMYWLSSMKPQLRSLEHVKRQVREKYVPLLSGKEGREFEAIKQEMDAEMKSVAKRWLSTGKLQAAYALGVASPESIRLHYQTRQEMLGANYKFELDANGRKIAEELSNPDRSPLLEVVPGVKESGSQYVEQHDNARRSDSFFYKYRGILEAAEREGIFDPSTKSGEQAMRMADRLANEMKAHPEMIPYIEQVFEGITSQATMMRLGSSIDVATLNDIRLMGDFFKHINNRTYIDKFLSGTLKDKERQKFTKWATMVFPETISRWLQPFDLSFDKEQVQKIATGEGIVDSVVRVPYTSLGEVARIMSAANEQTSSAANALDADFENRMSFLPNIREAGSTDNRPSQDTRELFSLAIHIREYGMKDYPGVKSSAYRDAYEAVKDRWAELAKKEYVVTVDGEPKTMTGLSIMGSIDAPQGLINRRLTEHFRDITRLIENDESFAKYRITDDSGGVDPYKTLERMDHEYKRTGTIPDIGIHGLYDIAHEMFLREQMVTDFRRGNNRVQGTIKKLLADGKITNQEAMTKLAELREKVGAKTGGATRVEILDHAMYFPHNGFDKGIVKAYYREAVETILKNHEEQVLSVKERRFLEEAVAEGHLADHQVGDWIMSILKSAPVQDNNEVDLNWIKPPQIASRSANVVPGWDRSEKAVRAYHSSLSRAYYNLYGALHGFNEVNRFRDRHVDNENSPLKDSAKQWANFGDIMIATALGKPAIFPRDWARRDNPTMEGLRNSPLWWTSEHMAEEKLRSIDKKFFGGKYFGVEKRPIPPDATLEQRMEIEAANNRDLTGNLDSKILRNRINTFSRWEAKWSLATLLNTPRSLFNNVVGGSTMTAISAGLRPFLLAGKHEYLSTINPEWSRPSDIDKFIEQTGGIESLLRSEIGPTGRFNAAEGRAFIADVTAKLRKDPNMSDADMLTLARRHNVLDNVTSGAAFFMRTGERWLRRRSYLAHYIRARDVLLANGASFAPDDPWLIGMARKGVTATQFLYNNASRPVFARTDLGKVLTRFQLWSWNSIRFRRDITREASALGYTPGTEQFERFRRMMTTDIFVYALAGLFPATMFESTLPAPWNYLNDFSQFLFGDEEERDGAFFGSLPYPANIVQPVTPPSFRVLTGPLTALMTGEWDQFLNYQLASWIPYGLLARSSYRTATNPEMVVENMTGFPLHRVARELDAIRDDEEDEVVGREALLSSWQPDPPVNYRPNLARVE